MDEVNNLVDVDNFLTFWVVESLIGFWDGYTQNQNNFFVYDSPKNGKFYFMPWGADSCFTAGGGPFARFGRSNQAASVRAESMLANRLFHTEIVPTRYKQTMLKVLELAWDEDKLISEVDRIQILTRDQLHANQEVGGNASPWGGRSLTMDGVRAFIRDRREKILSEFEDWPVEVASKPRKPMYTVEVGSASGTLETRWSTNANAKRLGNATNLKLKLHGSDVTLHDITVVAHPMQFFGFRGPRGGRAWTPPATIVLTGVRESDKENVTLTLMIDREALSEQPREPVQVSGSLSAGARGRFGFGPPGQMIAGTLDLSSTGTKDGDTIAGNFQLSIVEMHGGMMDRMRRGNRGRPGRPR
jgi:hypothetical protein